MSEDIESLRSELLTGLAELGIGPAEALADPLLQYLALLAKWNKAYNLTAVRDPAQMLTRHLLDSYTVWALDPASIGGNAQVE